MNRIFHFVLVVGMVIFAMACNPENDKKRILQEDNSVSNINDSIQINIMLDSFNMAAAQANFERYFGFFADEATFIGTDATENWNKKDFMIWAKPFFNRGRAWNFTSIDRHVYFHSSGEIAWFDELLDTQMKICRGSGVLVKQGNDWKIQQYVLSMTIPNNHTNAVVEIKSLTEDSLIGQLSGQTD